jgi:hypothetical protein
VGNISQRNSHDRPQEHMDWLCNLNDAIADTLEPLIEEIEAAREMRDKMRHREFYFNEGYFIDDRDESDVKEYDAIRKRNEGKEKI